MFLALSTSRPRIWRGTPFKSMFTGLKALTLAVIPITHTHYEFDLLIIRTFEEAEYTAPCSLKPNAFPAISVCDQEVRAAKDGGGGMIVTRSSVDEGKKFHTG